MRDMLSMFVEKKLAAASDTPHVLHADTASARCDWRQAPAVETSSCLSVSALLKAVLPLLKSSSFYVQSPRPISKRVVRQSCRVLDG